MFKFGTIGAFKQVGNNPRTKAVIDTKNGYVVIPDDVTGLSPTPATPTIAQSKDVYVAMNIIDKPEIRNSSDFYIAKDEHIRAFKLTDLADKLCDFSYDIVKNDYASVALNSYLVPCDDATDPDHKGKWKVSTDTDYNVRIQILEKTTYGDKGFHGKVVVK
ncbi:hypothetical protein [Paenibacillus sp. O199]|uniref:hypothetical protein n=1 Tax=Paenibacillus sp. O199 TaxID=1643925 RepID=UPI0007BEB20A|nr:hypothetical protein [Paenibacillus sp. O199]